MKTLYVLLVALFFSACAEPKKQITVAVASNFKATLEVIADRFQQQYDTEVVVVSASSGQLLAQIQQGAPFDVFLSADTAKVDVLLAERSAPSEATIYAQGRLALWVHKDGLNESSECWQHVQHDTSVAIANPRTAPYGAVARAFIEQFGSNEAEIITTANVALAFALVYQQQVDAGIVAFAHLKQHNITQGCVQILPTDQRLLQSMIVLQPSGKDFYTFMLRADIQKLIVEAGYVDLPDSP